MKSSLVIFFLALVSSLSLAQNFDLSGKVTDSKTNNPINGAFIFISHNIGTTSNYNGEFFLHNIPNGNYSIKISRIGYKTIITKVEINKNISSLNISLESSPIELDEVIVKTDRTDKFFRDSPYSGLLLGTETIQNKPFQSLPDLLKEEPGISLLRDGVWGTEVSIRGLNRENIVTLIDGNRIATSTDIAARLSMINLNDVDRIEVIKGASSSIYGSGATGGIINIITKSPQTFDKFSLSGNFTTGFNSVNNLSVTSASFYSGSSIWSAKLAGSYRKAENIQTPIGELKNSQFEDYNIDGSFNLIPMENHLVKLDYQLFKANNVGIPGASVFPDGADVRYPDEKRESVSAGYEIKNISKTFYKLSAKYSHQEIERNVENIPHQVALVAATGTTPAKRVSVLKITPAALHKNNNIQLSANLLPFEGNNLVLGIDYWDRSYNGHREKYQLIEVLNGTGNVVSSTNKVIGEQPLPDSKYKSLGFFAQDDADLIAKKLLLSVGARLDRINITGAKTLNPVYDITNGVYNYSPTGQKVIWNETESSDNSYSGNVGLKYSLDTNLDFTLGLGLSFRSPSLEERFQYIDQGSSVRVGDPNLKPEKGKSIDFGVRYYSSTFKIISSIFYNHFIDLVTEIPGTFEGRNAFIKTNIGEARLYGFDFHTEYNFYNDFVLYSTVSYVKGDDLKNDSNLPEIAPLNGILGTKFNIIENLSGDFSSTIFAAQNKVAAGEMTTPGYAIFDLSLHASNLKFASFGFDLYAGVENILNKEYRNHLSTTRGLITIEPGRNFFIKLAANF